MGSYCIETLYMALYLWLTDQVRRWSLSTNFWTSYAPWTNYQFSRLFFSLCLQTFIWYYIIGTLLCHTKIQSKCEFVFDPLIFPKVMALGLRRISRIISFPDFFSLCLQIFIWYLVQCFAIPIYRSSVGLVLIHWCFPKLWPLDIEKYHESSVFRTFFLST
jgi:hypothetical protein